MRRFATISTLLLGIVPPSLSATMDVIVGGPGVLKFTPSFVAASLGDVVRFTFQQKNHTATQSTFESPCLRAPGGFDSGFVPVEDGVTNGFPVAELEISTTNPIWVYCRQGNHCQQGMVFAVNPGDRFAAFQAAATGGSAPSTSTAPASTTSLVLATPSFTTSITPSAAAGLDHKVIVGGPGVLAYNPSNITAQVGDTITFEFREKNHTVTASSFDAPCRALALTSTSGEVGFDSGFQPIADDALTFPTFTIQVNDTKPIWAYCRQGNHCGQGMVFSANADESGARGFAAFRALAKQLNGTTSTTTNDAHVAAAHPAILLGALAFVSIFVL
ncbi:hypothetical protein NLJ89_g950 [Agrocybe chaxingu]|uniref:Cupredoxin n=1 Tax=Agrocybe chaxingu TaxID=84603 RepID=A0A9W8TF86_9AGAR|nr:hypothetical protein NLJ89_g950 [Agrocybe chaxingu]